MKRRTLLSVGLAGVLAAAFPSVSLAASKAEQRAEVRQNAQSILKQLYKTNPSARGLIENAAGYATFSNFGMKILLLGGGTGQGLAVDRESGKETFMKMMEVQGGLGFGVKKFRLVFVFETKEALRRFIDSGWESSAQATLAATDGRHGAAYQGAVPISPGVWLFQLTDKGLAAEATIKGTRYYKDDSLN